MEREEFDALNNLVLGRQSRRRCWKRWDVVMTNDDVFKCGIDVCPINQWIRMDGLDTGFVFCNRCTATGVTPDEFYI